MKPRSQLISRVQFPRGREFCEERGLLSRAAAGKYNLILLLILNAPVMADCVRGKTMIKGSKDCLLKVAPYSFSTVRKLLSKIA